MIRAVVVGCAVLVAGFVATVATVTATPAAAATNATTTTTLVPTGDAFDAPPDPLPAAKPGSVIRAASIPAPDGARAWRVLVHTRSLDGRDAALSGVVVAPDGRAPRGGRPVLSWAHGTTGLADACAPSRSDDVARNLPWVDELLAAGYVVVATDYQGLGTPGLHPYLVGESEGRSVLDLARAARNLPTGAGRKVLIGGHSQGGHAALFAGEIAASYAPDLKVLGVAAGAPVTDPQAFLAHTARAPSTFGVLVMGVEGYEAVYPELVRSPVLSPAVVARAGIVASGCAPEVLEAYAGDDLGEGGPVDPSADPAWASRLGENAAGAQPAGAPVLVWQGDADDLTPAAVTTAYVARACAQGSTVDYRRYPGANHVTVLAAAHDDVLAFFDARWKGIPATSTC